MNAAELFVKCLENEDVEYVFGVPGEENAHMMMALKESSIKFILCRHEQGAAFMADVYGRLTGRAAVCLATLGPGATNLVTGVADANMDRSPVVVITGQADSRRQHKESHQNMDVVAMFRPITKWAHPIIHSLNIPEVVRKAFKLAEAEKVRLKNDALKGVGSERMVGLKMADVYKGLDLIVLSSDGMAGVNPLDLDNALKLFDVRKGGGQ